MPSPGSLVSSRGCAARRSSSAHAAGYGRNIGDQCRRRLRCAADGPVFGAKGDQVSMRRSGGRADEQPVVALVVQRVSNLLTHWPLLLGRPRRRKADTSQACVVVKQRHPVQVDAPPPQISRDRIHRRKPGARQCPIPLGPRRIRLVGEIPGRDGSTLLPAAVGRFGRQIERVAAVRDMSDEEVVDAASVDVELGHATRRACLRAKQRAATRCDSRLPVSHRPDADRRDARSA